MPQGLLVVPGEWLQRNIAGNTEGMAGLAGGGKAQGLENTTLHQGQHPLIATPPDAGKQVEILKAAAAKAWWAAPSLKPCPAWLPFANCATAPA